MLSIAAALASDDHPVALGDAVSGIGREHLELVLAAIAHAAGSHGHSTPVHQDDGTLDDGPRIVGFERPQPLPVRRRGAREPWSALSAAGRVRVTDVRFNDRQPDCLSDKSSQGRVQQRPPPRR